MKSIFLIFVLQLTCSLTLFAQTKKIALRSHSGNMATFTIYVPDDFGLGPNYEELRQREERLKKLKKDTSSLSTIELNELNNPAPLGQCTPYSDSLYKAQEESVRQISSSILPTPYKTPNPIVKDSFSTTPNQTIPPTQQKETIDTTKKAEEIKLLKTTSQGSMGFLVLLLTIPALLAIGLEYFKK